MDDVWDALEAAVAAVVAFPCAGLADDVVRGRVLGVQGCLDRLRGVHAGLLHEAERRLLWQGSGYRSAADWLAGVAKTSRGEAQSRARLGKALGASKKLKDALADGSMSAATAESVSHAVNDRPDGASDGDVDDLVDACRGADPVDAREAVETWRRTFDGDSEHDAEERRHQRRSLTVKPVGDGMAQLTALLPEVRMRQVVNSISQAAGKPCEHDQRTTAQRLADGLVQLTVAHAKGEVKGGREKPTILITIGAEAYAGQGEGFTAHGDRVPAHVVRMLAEDAVLQRVLTIGAEILELGREVRYASEAQYRALVVRDGGCRWPGCRIPAGWCDIDHLLAWEDGGRSDLDNLVMWCRHHHTEKHRPGVQVLGGVHDLRLRLADGTIVYCSPNKHATAPPGRTGPPGDPGGPPDAHRQRERTAAAAA